MNQESLDENTIERIHHNQLYNDDTLFDHFSIFQHLNKDESDSLVIHEDVKNSDLNLNKGSNDIEHIKVMGDDQNNNSADQLDPSVVVNDDVENKELLNEQDLADFDIWDEIESERISHQDENEDIQQPQQQNHNNFDTNQSNDKEINYDSKSVLKSLSHISMVSDRNGIEDWSTPHDMFEQKASNLDRESTFKKHHEENENKLDFSRKCVVSNFTNFHQI